MKTARARTAPCPRCGEPASLASANPWRPFCSERCKMIDLGKWAMGAYSIPAEEQSPDTAAEDQPEGDRKH